MKAVILAGGYGTRIGEETHLKPKPMIEIGTKPILWHIMSLYSHYGITEFIICLGYKGYAIKEFFLNYNLHMSDFTIQLNDNTITSHSHRVETQESYTNRYWCKYRNGWPSEKIQNYVGDEPFCLTYGDGLSNVNIKNLLHSIKHGKMATVTPYNLLVDLVLILDKQSVTSFQEKPLGDGGWVNGGFFVLNPEVFNYISGDKSVLKQTL